MVKRSILLGGVYDSAFFNISIEIDKPLIDINCLDEQSFGLFIHEYIHFIQDITTIHGLTNIHIIIEYLKQALNSIYQQTHRKIKLPILPNLHASDLVYFNYKIKKITAGDQWPFENVNEISRYEIKTEDIPQCPIPQIECVQIFFNDEWGGSQSYQFGADCIYESMAYIIEKNLSFSCNESPDLPYNSARLLTQYIYPEFADDEFNILALCDISLNSSNPGLTFVRLLELWKSEMYLPDYPSELFYRYNTMPIIKTIAHKNKIQKYQTYPLIDMFDIVKIVKEQLYSYFRYDLDSVTPEWKQICDNLHNWIDAIFESCLKWRIGNPSFMIQIAEIPDRLYNARLIQLFNTFGVPLCINKNGEGFLYHPQIKDSNFPIDFFAAMGQIYRLLIGAPEGKNCSLYNRCLKNPHVVTNQLCKTAPWKKCDELKSCPFSVMWHHCNLKKYSITLPTPLT